MKRPPLFPALDRRATAPERMDDPHADRDTLYRTLRQFAWINRWLTRAHFLLARTILPDMRRDPERLHHLVDLGAGACDIPARFLKRCARENLRLRVTACDHDPRVVAFARRRYGHVEGLTIARRDAADLGDLKPIDYLFASHLLHHLPEPNIVALLHNLAHSGARIVLLNDIERSRAAYLGFYVAASLLWRRSYAREDGLLSIRKGFRPAEWRAVLAACGEEGRSYRIERLAPARIVLIGGAS